MHGFPTLPLLAQDACHQLLLHTVLSLDAKDVPDPNTRNAHSKLSQNDGSHDTDGPVDGTRTHTRGSIDGALHGPYREQ